MIGEEEKELKSGYSKNYNKNFNFKKWVSKGLGQSKTTEADKGNWKREIKKKLESATGK